MRGIEQRQHHAHQRTGQQDDQRLPHGRGRVQAATGVAQGDTRHHAQREQPDAAVTEGMQGE